MFDLRSTNTLRLLKFYDAFEETTVKIDIDLKRLGFTPDDDSFSIHSKFNVVQYNNNTSEDAQWLAYLATWRSLPYLFSIHSVTFYTRPVKSQRIKHLYTSKEITPFERSMMTGMMLREQFKWIKLAARL